jgi:hypothetical protein
MAVTSIASVSPRSGSRPGRRSALILTPTYKIEELPAWSPSAPRTGWTPSSAWTAALDYAGPRRHLRRASPRHGLLPRPPRRHSWPPPRRRRRATQPRPLLQRPPLGLRHPPPDRRRPPRRPEREPPVLLDRRHHPAPSGGRWLVRLRGTRAEELLAEALPYLGDRARERAEAALARINPEVRKAR